MTFLIHAPDFSLDETINSAQMFRCWREDGGYRVHNGRRALLLKQRGDAVEVRSPNGITEAEIIHFLALDEDHAALCERLSEHPELRPAVRACRGLRILRQDPWECLVGFICSSCCNVPRIRRVIDSICEAVAPGNSCAFPKPGSLPSQEELRDLGTGYRARYLHAANQPAMRDWLNGLRLQEFSVARRRLMSLDGVGEKVADCVLLYSLGFREAFPVDVWVRRAMEAVYFNGRKTPARCIQTFAAERFGRDAGYAQQFLFHQWRTGRHE